MKLRFADLEWRSTPMPGGSGPVELARLPRLPDDAFRAFVRFPPGWSRHEAGHYPVAEEFFVLGGELALNGLTWSAGGFAWLPARLMRRALHSVSGCLVFAWFESPPRWIPGERAEGDASAREATRVYLRDAPEGLLYEGPQHRTWIVRRGFATPTAAGTQGEMLDLRSFEWRSMPPSEPGPALGATLVRAWPCATIPRGPPA